MGVVKQILKIKLIFTTTINLKNFDARLLKVDKKSYKDIVIYNIGYITIKKLMIMKISTA